MKQEYKRILIVFLIVIALSFLIRILFIEKYLEISDIINIFVAIGTIGATVGAFYAVKKTLDMREEDKKEKIFQNEKMLIKNLIDAIDSAIIEYNKLITKKLLSFKDDIQEIFAFYSIYYSNVSSLSVFVKKEKCKNKFISEYINELASASNTGITYLYKHKNSILNSNSEKIMVESNVNALNICMQNISKILNYILMLDQNNFFKVINFNFPKDVDQEEKTKEILKDNFHEEEFDFTKFIKIFNDKISKYKNN